jgi:hypothetical protein
MGSEDRDRTPYAVVEYLEEHGPAPAEQLPTEVAPHHRAEGIRSFRIRGNTSGAGVSFGGDVRPVYHLTDESPVTVLSIFFEENSHLVENAAPRGLIRRCGNHGPAWRDAARTVLADEYGIKTGKSPPDEHGTPQPVNCPLCGERVDDLETHLQEDCQ